ncbi:MAG: UDP-N-acetylmuramate--alanine ligase [Candidatus Atribacteria bacterium]|nr:UDP-N-acetylmuramate--alanine ligase [Candidatus Atribacteria bacterium]
MTPFLPRDFPRSLYFVGIGGTGMSGLALVAHGLGCRVSGSDIAFNQAIFRLRQRGIEVFVGHRREQIGQVDAMVISSAIPSDNEELREARSQGIPIIHRGELLSLLLNPRQGIAIAGTHGKTTTTSMISLLLEIAGLKPTVLIGGELEDIGGNAKVGEGEFFVAEADESDGSFLNLAPFCAVVTNIEDDHLEFYGGMDQEKAAFAKFLNQIKEGGFAVVCGDHPNVINVVQNTKVKSVFSYGIQNGQSDLRGMILAENGNNQVFQVEWKGKKLGNFYLNVPGKHNVLNALACLAVGLGLDIPLPLITDALATFRGVKRRFELIGTVKGAQVIDDYAHHPTEMKAVLETAFNQTAGKIVVVFQPHRFTRTSRLYREMGRVLTMADYVFLLPVYPAGEAEIAGVSSELIYQELKETYSHPVDLCLNFQEVASRCWEILSPGDIVITMGAGDVWKVGALLCQQHGKS